MFVKSLASIAFVLLLAACGSDATDAVADAADDVEGQAIESGELGDAVSDAGQQLRSRIGEADLSTVYTAMDLVGFDEINSDQPFTFFAPNDSAFSSMTPDEMADLLAEPDRLQEILSNHYVDVALMADDLTATSSVISAGGLPLLFDTSGETPTVNGIDIVRTDIATQNGVIHVIDGVLATENS